MQVISTLGCSVISVAFYYMCDYFSLLMPYWLKSTFHIYRIDFLTPLFCNLSK
jgi:hypothetical protein